jgi:hypothetical protein
MPYTITAYTRRRASALGVQVKPSTRKGKKIDVFKGGKKVASLGALGMMDFPNFKKAEREGRVKPGTAERRRKAYMVRHRKDKDVYGSPGYYAANLVW